jgi:2-aminoethylphosphonate-pyruvate transaminase
LITAFEYLKREGFSFDRLYRQLSERGFIIYPGKLTQVDTFRIGTIGRIFPEDVKQLTHAINELVNQ